MKTTRQEQSEIIADVMIANILEDDNLCLARNLFEEFIAKNYTDQELKEEITCAQ